MGNGERGRIKQGMEWKGVDNPRWVERGNVGGRETENGMINRDGEEKGGKRGPQSRSAGEKNYEKKEGVGFTRRNL